VFVSFELKGPIDAKRVVVTEIRLLDDHGKTIAADTYQCADMRASAGREVMPGIRASSLQGVALSRCDHNLKNRVAEVEFRFKDR
jgi:hypothetical protein